MVAGPMTATRVPTLVQERVPPHTGFMAMLGADAKSQTSAVERFLAVDEQGTGLRVTWRPALGVMNLSLWRDDTCVGTFHLSTVEAGRLVAFVATSLAKAVPTPADRGLHLVADAPTPVRGARARAAKDHLVRAATHVTRRVRRSRG